jgi:hypothetical protein
MVRMMTVALLSILLRFRRSKEEESCIRCTSVDLSNGWRGFSISVRIYTGRENLTYFAIEATERVVAT